MISLLRLILGLFKMKKFIILKQLLSVTKSCSRVGGLENVSCKGGHLKTKILEHYKNSDGTCRVLTFSQHGTATLICSSQLCASCLFAEIERLKASNQNDTDSEADDDASRVSENTLFSYNSAKCIRSQIQDTKKVLKKSQIGDIFTNTISATTELCDAADHQTPQSRESSLCSRNLRLSVSTNDEHYVENNVQLMPVQGSSYTSDSPTQISPECIPLGVGKDASEYPQKSQSAVQ